jgi:hypothetical protein
VRFSYHANIGIEVGIACKSRVYTNANIEASWNVRSWKIWINRREKKKTEEKRSEVKNRKEKKRKEKRKISGEIEAERDLWGEAGDMHRLFG